MNCEDSSTRRLIMHAANYYARAGSKSKEDVTGFDQFVPVTSRYVLLKPLRLFVTVKVPSGCADTLNQ